MRKVEACERLIEYLQLNVREAHDSVQLQQVVKSVSQFNLEQPQSGGEIVERIKHQAQANTAENVIVKEINDLTKTTVCTECFYAVTCLYYSYQYHTKNHCGSEQEGKC
jgi:hypothetical protein